MNTYALVNFLTHCLVLLIIINIVDGLIVMYTSENVFNYFFSHELLAIDATKPQRSVFLGVDVCTIIIHGFGVLLIMTAIIALVGLIYLSKHPIIIFAGGLSFVIMAFVEFGGMVAISYLQNSLDLIILNDLSTSFESSAGVLDSALEKYKGEDLGTVSPENPEDEGWGIVAQGSKINHSQIDYYQLNNQCCGLNGRHSWLYLVPTSCCPDNYSYINCTFAAAHTMNCKRPYKELMAMLTTMQVEHIFFGVLALLAGICALCLSRINSIYPDGNYGSDTWSSSDDDD